MTLEDLSQEYNISRERVRQIEVRAFEKLPNTLSAPGHFHSQGTLAMNFAGSHAHQYNDYYWHDSGNDPEYGTPVGDGTGQRLQELRVTLPQGGHVHFLTGSAGNTAGGDGDAALGITGDLEHVVLRLCVKN